MMNTFNLGFCSHINVQYIVHHIVNTETCASHNRTNLIGSYACTFALTHICVNYCINVKKKKKKSLKSVYHKTKSYLFTKLGLNCMIHIDSFCDAFWI